MCPQIRRSPNPDFEKVVSAVPACVHAQVCNPIHGDTHGDDGLIHLSEKTTRGILFVSIHLTTPFTPFSASLRLYAPLSLATGTVVGNVH